MTLSGAGIAFIATFKFVTSSCFQQIILSIALVFLASSLAAGLFVWSRAAVMLSNDQFDLDDLHLRIPGLVNVVTFAVGVIFLGSFVLIRIWV